MSIVHTLSQAGKVVPATLIVLFIGLLWLLGLMCNQARRSYVTALSKQAMETVGKLMHGPDTVNPPSRRGSN